MNIVHEFVINMDDLEVIVPKLINIGASHGRKGIEPKYLDIMGPVFCNAVRPILLKSKLWSTSTEEAWMEVFRVIASIMKRGFESRESTEHELTLAPTQKCIIIATWHSIFLKHMTSMGKTLFIDMFKVEPNILHYFDAFKDSGINDVALNRKFQAHGQRVMGLIKFVVENIENTDKLREHLVILGRMHAKKKIDPKFLDLMGPTFCQAIRPMVMAEGQWCLDIELAWAHLFKVLVHHMSSAYPKELEAEDRFPSAGQAKLILESWTEIRSSIDEIGFETFQRLFASHSNIQAYFPAMKKLSSTDLEMSRSIKEHSVRIMAVIKLYVDNIQHLDRIEPNIEALEPF